MSKLARSLEKNFVVVSPDKKATVESVDAKLYERLNSNYNGFKGHDLISCYEFNQDWSTWEIHPNGDEIVVLLSGNVTFVLQLDEGNQSIQLQKEGAYVIVPKNVWHTLKTNIKSKVLFITPGEGTQNKDV